MAKTLPPTCCQGDGSRLCSRDFSFGGDLMKKLMCLVLATAAFGCATAQMTVPPEVAKDTDVIAATDRSSGSGLLVDESFKLGKLSIDEVDRDWDSTSSLGVLSFSKDRTSGGYSYLVKGAGSDLQGGCVTE